MFLKILYILSEPPFIILPPKFSILYSTNQKKDYIIVILPEPLPQ